MNFGILAPVVAFLGLVIGSMISSYAWEEIEPGKKYLRALRKIILGLIITLGMACAFLYSGIIIVLLGAIAAISAARIRKSTSAEYAYLGLLSVSVLLLPLFIQLIFFSLVFVYGMLCRNSKEQLRQKALFFFLPFAVLLFANMALAVQIFSFSSASLVFFMRKQ